MSFDICTEQMLLAREGGERQTDRQTLLVCLHPPLLITWALSVSLLLHCVYLCPHWPTWISRNCNLFQAAECKKGQRLHATLFTGRFLEAATSQHFQSCCVSQKLVSHLNAREVEKWSCYYHFLLEIMLQFIGYLVHRLSRSGTAGSKSIWSLSVHLFFHTFLDSFCIS